MAQLPTHSGPANEFVFAFGARRAGWLLPTALAAALMLGGCGGGVQGQTKWPESTQKWFDRAELSYRHGDLEDAEHAADEALRTLPKDSKVRLLAAKIALAQLNFEKTLALTEGLTSSDARGIRGRAFWYSNDLTGAALELGKVAADPEVRDPWAVEVAELARSGQGGPSEDGTPSKHGRHPFQMSGGLAASVEMWRAGSTAMIVEVEVNGTDCLALIATDSPETIIDSADKRGAWLSLRFGGQNTALQNSTRIEVSDVPALGRDLSGIKREVNADIKLLIGVNLLRHLRPTIDFSGRQFVVRSFDPPAPPEATTLHPVYYRGGAIVLPVAYGADEAAPLGTLLMHTSMSFPVALDEAAWTKIGRKPSEFAPIVGQKGLREGLVPFLRLGTFDLNEIPGVYGAGISKVEKVAEADLDGFAGSGLFATLRMTLTDGGRTLWLEDLPPEVLAMHRTPKAAPMKAPLAGEATPGAAPGAPAPRAPAPSTPAPSTPAPSAPRR
jgi:hypothetical protein